ncbi:MAG: SRPBCC family protein [Chloroflexi bacterium]|nr:SRPBCC family protein [Chloroflexota bacterium]
MTDATTAIEPIELTLELGVDPEDAFTSFADRFRTWWPSEASWSGAGLESIGIEPFVGGFCYERGPHGLRLDWGRVTAWEPPNRLAFAWLIGADRTPEPNPAHASEVEVSFAPTPAGTRLVLVHRGFERHRGDGVAYRRAMASNDAGWPMLLERYRALIVRRTEAPWEGLTT